MPDRLKVRVAAKRTEAEDICSFELVSTTATPLPPFSAGSHIDVQIPGGPTRQYSLCNAGDAPLSYLICVLRDHHSRGGSSSLHAYVNVGDELTISTPRNHFPLADDASHSVLLAGGIGITPILCMAERLAKIGSTFNLHYCTRSRARTAFLGRVTHSDFIPHTHLYFDDEARTPRLDLGALLESPQAGTHLYVCGPKGFMDVVLTTARELGWPESQLHYEFFAAEQRRPTENERFEIEIASTGKVIVVEPDQSAVQALANAGITVETSCEQGVCGSCLTRVLAGEPDHFDVYLSEQEQEANDQFLPCCSRAKSARLVLDL
ncbi:oxidoreductase [Pseudomonas putida]|uniref:PDR/VanB family oxidoreductase n=1 Tax=Pseudomonas putida TaxID=303 RepID=UPI001F51FB7B|nr:PDR/VanB family oxidoreductase [Pseudomonas putida]MCI1025727.1 oxidoreductase [Pseudomonas putida]